MNLFKRNKQKQQNTEATEVTPMKNSKKLKTTYVCQIKNTMMSPGVFSLCKTTPMPVVIVNGEQIQNTSGYISSQRFPNPGANNMTIHFKDLEPIMGERLASTIVEYLDKTTKEPIICLYPTNDIAFKGTSFEAAVERLNHATRRDLKRQIEKREPYVKKMFAELEKKAKEQKSR